MGWLLENTLKKGMYLFVWLFAATNIYAEGTKETAPTATDVSMLYTCHASFGVFAGYNAPVDSRLHFQIANPGSEQVYIGLSQQASTSNTTDGDLIATAYYFRIKDPNGNIVFGPQIINATTANANTWALATAGPAPIVGATGYTPFTFTPAPGAPAGDYYIEFSDNANNPAAATAIAIKYWDFTVATRTVPTAINGRVWSKKWGIRTPNIARGADPTYSFFDRPFNGSFVAYSDDGFVDKIDFNGSGFRGLSFNISLNESGTAFTGDPLQDRRSVAGSNQTFSQYKLFLNDPDINIYPSGEIGAIVGTPFVVNCPGSSTPCISYAVTKPGFVQIILDFDSATGAGIYDEGTADVLLVEAVTPGVGEQPPYRRCMDWNGLNGLGVPVTLTNPIPMHMLLEQGVMNLPVYDVEYHPNGYVVTNLRPAPTPGHVIKFFYDDTNIAAASGSGEPNRNLTNGCTPPCHRWTNLAFGDANTINTVWYTNTVKTSSNVVSFNPTCAFTGPASVCESTSGIVYTGPAGQDQYAWTISGNGTIVGPSNGQNVTVTSGTFGSYTLTLTTTTSTCSINCSQTVQVGLSAYMTCGTSGGLTFTGPPAMSSYAWSITGNGTITGPTNGQTVSVTPGASGTFSLTLNVVNAQGCSATTTNMANALSPCTINFKDLYLSDPAQSLDRIDPVATADATTAVSPVLGTGFPRSLFALHGGTTTGYSRYDITGNSWVARATTPANVGPGGALTSDGTFIYALEGNNTSSFRRYNPVTNTWTSMTSTPAIVAAGGALVHSAGFIYAFAGNGTTTFWRYNIAANTWSTMAVAPATVGYGGALVAAGGNLYAYRGNNTTAFWRYNIAANTWTVLAVTPGTIQRGGALVYDGTNIYGTRGNGTTTFYRYNIAGNTWATMANAPGAFNQGTGLAVEGTTIYALRGNATANLYSYNATANTWATLGSLASTVSDGGALVSFGNGLTGDPSATFTESPVLCSNLVVKAGQTITVNAYTTITAGTMPASPNITATISYGATTIVTLSSPTYNSGTGLLTWTGTIPTDVVVPAGQAIALQIATFQSGVTFTLSYDSQTSPSKIILPTTTFIEIANINFYNAPYAGGTIITNGNTGSTAYLRVVVNDPFGFSDINGLDISRLNPDGSTTVLTGTSVGTVGCSRIYELVWPLGTVGDYLFTVTAKEGYENTVVDVGTIRFSVCPITVTANVTTIPTCTLPSSGVITYSVTGGNGPYTFAWTRGAATGSGTGTTISGLSQGTYLITVTSAGGCTGTASVVINPPQPPTVSNVFTNITCNGGANGTINLTVSGGVSPYTYSWVGGNTNQDRVGLTAGTRTVTVTGANGCTTTNTITLTQPTAVTATTTLTQPTCFSNGTIILNPSGGTPAYTYDWADLVGASNSKDRLGLVPGTYNVTIYDSRGCTYSAAIVMTNPVCDPTAVDVCISNTADVFSVTPDPMVDTYTWTVPAGAVIVSGQGTPTIVINWAGSSPGTGQVCVKSINICGESALVCQTVYIHQVAGTASVGPTCLGGNLQLFANGGVSYAWSGPSGFTSNSANPVIFNTTLANAGTYTVTVTDDNGCTAVSSVNVVLNTPPVAATAPSNAGCGTATGSVNLTPSSGSAPYAFLWSSGQITEDISGVLAGAYTVTVTDVNGCTATSVASVGSTGAPTLTPAVTNVACFGGATGAINITASGANSPFEYYWSNGATTQNITGLPIGTYSVSVTNTLGCTAVSSSTITQPNPIQIDGLQTNINCFGIASGAINITASGGTSPYTYDWADIAGAVNAEDRTALTAGTYTVIVRDANNCTATASYIITQPSAALAVSTSVTNLTCNGVAEGVINLTVTGGTPVYTYAWTGGVTTQDRFNLTAGTYNITVTDARGCTSSTSAIVSQPAALALTTTQTNVLCNGGSNGAIDLTVAGGTVPYTYLWSSGATTQDITGRTAGTYSVTVRDANGCTASASIAITQPAVLATTNIVTNINCFGNATGAIDLTVTGGTSPYAYLWSSGATTQDITGMTAGTYIVTVTDNNACSIVSSITITQVSAVAVAGAVTNVACNGGSTGAINITASGGTSPYTYDWADIAGTSNAEDRTALVAGTYSVTVSDANGCTASQTYTITQPTALALTSVNVNSRCNGANNGSINLSVSGGVPAYTFLWSNGATTEDLSGLGAGTFTVTVTDFQGCTATRANVMTQPAALAASAVATPVSCFGGSNGTVTLTRSGGTTPYSFSWSNGSVTQNLINRPAGTYTVTVNDANGCSVTATATVTQPLAPVSISAAVTNVSCNNGTDGAINISINGGTPAYTFLWTGGATTEDIYGRTAGTYVVTVTDSRGCTASATYAITQPPAGLALSNVKTDVSCNGGADGTINLVVSGGTQPFAYLWSNGQTFQDLSNLTQGSYSVTVTDSRNCTATATINITQPTAIALSAVSVQATSCGANDGSINLTVSGGTAPYLYNWSNGDVTQDISGLTTGTYDVTVTDANSCIAVLENILVNEASTISLSAVITQNLCPGGNSGAVNLTATGGAAPLRFVWTNGATTEDIANLTAGTYTVAVSDQNGCVRFLTAIITDPSGNAMTLSSVITPSACILPTGAVNLSVTGGTAPYTYIWSNGATTQDLANISSGTYTVTTTDGNGCTRVMANLVGDSGAPVLTSTSTDATCFGASTGSITTSRTGGTAPFTYAWSNGATTANLTNAPAGAYRVTITDVNLCDAIALDTIGQPTVLTVTTSKYDPSCALNDGQVFATPSGGTPNYTYAWSTGGTTSSIANRVPGTYTVTTTDSRGCTATGSSVLATPACIPPVAINDTFYTLINTPISNTVATNDYDLDNNASELFFQLLGTPPPTTGVLTMDAYGNFTFTPATNYTGYFTVPYQLCDITGLCDTAYLTIIINPLLSVSGVVTNVDCFGGNTGAINVTPVGGIPPLTYLWNNGATTQDRSNLIAGTYLITVTDNIGNTVAASFTVTQPAAPLSATASHDSIYCFGATSTLTVTASGGTSPYQFNRGTGNQPSGAFPGLSAGSYTVTVTDANNCTTTVARTIGQPTNLVITVQPVSITRCSGFAAPFSVTASGGTPPLSYQWQYFNGTSWGNIVNGTPTGANYATATNSLTVTGGIAAGAYQYRVVIRDAVGTCNAVTSATATLTINANPVPAATSNSPICAGNNLQLSAMPNGMTGYAWSGPNSFSSNIQNPLITAATTAATGTYQLTVTNGNGCSATTSTAVTVFPAPSITASTNSPCVGQTIILLSAPVGGTTPYGFSWSGPLNYISNMEDPTPFIAYTTAYGGVYTVILTDTNGCTASASATATVQNPPAKPGAIGY